jgi:2-haloacid dehalogenase
LSIGTCATDLLRREIDIPCFVCYQQILLVITYFFEIVLYLTYGSDNGSYLFVFIFWSFMKNIIFDVGKVLIQWDVRPFFIKHFDNQEAVENFLKEVDFFNWNLELDRGLSFQEGVQNQSTKFPKYAPIFEAFNHRWSETVPGPIVGTVDILNQLKTKNIPLYAITNFSHEKWPVACEMFPYLGNSFIDTVVSGEMKMIKPNPAIYQLLLDRNKLKAEDCIFIDDTLDNVQAAIALGIDGLLFTSPEQFAKDLKERDVL